MHVWETMDELAKKWALAMHRQLPPWRISLEDLEQACWVGLLEAQERYDPERGVAFAWYAHGRAWGAMRDALRNSDSPWMRKDNKTVYSRSEPLDTHDVPHTHEHSFHEVLLAGLTPHQQRILWLVDVLGYPVQEAAEILCVAPTAVTQAKVRAYRRIRNRTH